MDAGNKSKTLCRINGGLKASAHIGQPCIQLGAAIPAFGGSMKEIIYDLEEDRFHEVYEESIEEEAGKRVYKHGDLYEPECDDERENSEELEGSND